MTSQFKPISWRELPGNKFNRALHPAMLSEEGCSKLMPVPCASGSQMKEVIYDRNYVVEWVALKLFKALDGKSYAEIVEILEEAYDSLLVKEYAQLQITARQHDEWKQP